MECRWKTGKFECSLFSLFHWPTVADFPLNQKEIQQKKIRIPNRKVENFEKKRKCFHSFGKSKSEKKWKYKRKWKCIDGDVHHIIDSRSRISVQSDVVSASVIHKDGAVADAYATYAIVLGMERALDFLQSEGIDFEPAKVDLFEVADMLAKATPAQKKELADAGLLPEWAK